MMCRGRALLRRALCALHAGKLRHAPAAAPRLRLSRRARSRASPGHDEPDERPCLATHGAHEPLPAACAHAVALSAHQWSPRSWYRDMVPQRRHLLARPEPLWQKGAPQY